jgi:peptidoglycan/LPS O-acetylase OafA/YrhL
VRVADYRRDIDGLRAVAVLPVVLFHAGLPLFSGGYVGVDVFFVISGFLITGMLVERPGGVSISDFYNRRVRRIFPALFVMLAVVTAAALVILTPLDLKRYAMSLGATATFCSNVFFYLGAGYFETASAEKPLLHTWSLAVEEQFYILWPLVLWAMRGMSRRALLAVTLLLMAASFGLSVWLTPRNPDAAFFLPFARLWELLLGSALALRPVALGKPARQAASMVGLGLLAYAFVAFDQSTAFPGYAVAAPCLGTALLLAANGRGDTWVAKLLSLRPVVFVGLISYSLYLWHWPLLAFGRYVAYRPLTAPEATGLLVLAMLLAALSWRFVEQPFRRRFHQPGAWRRSLPLGAVAAGIALALAGLFFIAQGFPARVPPSVVRAEAVTANVPNLRAPCDPKDPAPRCRMGVVTQPASFVLWGDSQAAALAPGLYEAATRAGLAGVRYSTPGCPPMLGVRQAYSISNCQAFNEAALRSLTEAPQVDTVVLTAYWVVAAEAVWFGETVRRPGFLLDDQHSTPSPATNRAVFAAGLDRMVAAIRKVRPDVRIVLVGQPPEVRFHTPRCLARMAQLRRPDDKCRSVAEPVARARLAYTKQTLRAVAARYGGEVFMMDEQTCRNGRCYSVIDGMILYIDDHHLTPEGARRLTRDFPLRAPDGAPGRQTTTSAPSPPRN